MWTPLRKAPRMENRLWEELRVWGRSHSLARSQTYSAELGDGSPPSRPQSYSDPRRAQGSHWTQHQEYPQVTYGLEGWSPGLRSLLAAGTPSRCSLLVRGRMPRHLATPCQDRAFGQAHPRSVLRPGCWAEDKDPTSFQIRLQTKKRVMEFTHLRVSHLCENRALPGLFPPSGRPDRSRQKSQASSLWIPRPSKHTPESSYRHLLHTLYTRDHGKFRRLADEQGSLDACPPKGRGPAGRRVLTAHKCVHPYEPRYAL